MIARVEAPCDTNGQQSYLWLWCDGCETHHVVPITGPRAWQFNGDVEKPTLAPSIRVTYPRTANGGREPLSAKTCHSFVRDGRWQYLSDCTHRLAGQTVPLPELP
ncbi:MAG: DUF6527 family protein [Vicinamibacterales bacterium]